MSKKKNAVIGDWVRYYNNGRMVIGVVQYVGKDDVLGHVYYDTDIGRIEERYVLEVRGA